MTSAVDYFPYGAELRSYGKSRYLTTQHERDLETGFDYRGARFYDSEVGRFLSVDPLAAKYVSWSSYNYVFGNPIIYTDPDGRGPVRDENGKIIGYKVEEGQGPTQIAEDLNNNFGCELTCETVWTEIVYNNALEFENVYKGKGEIEDEYNGDYRSGNIQVGTVLDITNGKEVIQTKDEVEKDKIERKIDSFQTEITKASENFKNFKAMKDFQKWERNDPGGIGAGMALTLGAARNERDSVNMTKVKKKLEEKRDSLSKIIDNNESKP